VARQHSNENLPEPRKKEIFLALVEAQDKSMPVAQSRTLIAHRFHVSVQEVLLIEEEGMDQGWPPL